MGVSSHETLGYCFTPDEAHIPLETRFARFLAVSANNGAFALSTFKGVGLAINVQQNNVLAHTFSMLGKYLGVHSVKLINVPFSESIQIPMSRRLSKELWEANQMR
jgi:hypothetical protein